MRALKTLNQTTGLLRGLLGLATMLATAGYAQTEMRVHMMLPEEALDAQESFEVPIYVEDGELNLASYALRLDYDPQVLHILEITGGVFPGFSNTPVSNPASYASGMTDFTANNQGFIDTPAMFEIARVRFEIVGIPGALADVALELSPHGGLVDRSDFALAPAALPQGGTVAVASGQAPNMPPVADAGSDLDGQVGAEVTLSGEGSYDPDASPVALAYQWSFVAVPAGSLLDDSSLAGADRVMVRFTPDSDGEYRLRLDVTDGVDSASDFVQVQVSTPGSPPVSTNLTARAKGVHVNLGWARSEGATHYLVYRRLDDESEFTIIGQTTKLLYFNNFPGRNLSASYYVVAENVHGASDASNVVTVEHRARRRGRR